MFGLKPSYIPHITCIYIYTMYYISGCQNHGPLLGSLNTRCRTVLYTTYYMHIIYIIYSIA